MIFKFESVIYKIMKKPLFYLGLAMMLFFINIPVNSQDYIKYDQIDQKYFTENKCGIDSSAHAFFIFNEQSCIFYYNRTNVIYDNGMLTQGTDYQNKIHLHRAIKILDDDAAEEWSSFSFTYTEKYYKVGTIKGYTYNMENGKVVKSKLERSQITTEELSNERRRLKIVMPNVKMGSVLELEVNIDSDDFYSSGPWQMQYTIPIEKNILVLTRPEYYNYNRIFKGYYPLEPKYSELVKKVQISITDNNVQRTVTHDEIIYREYTEEYYMDNVPAFPVESYLSTPDNYMSSLMFELSYTSFPNSPQKRYNTSWESVNKQLIYDEMLGKQIENTGFLSDQAAKLKSNAKDQITLLKSCYEFIRDTVTCNNSTGIFCDKGIKDVWKNKKGDVPGINLLLTALLREAGIKAYPVMLSTRSNGMVQPVYPSISDFNYLIVMADVDGKKILMDASDKYLTLGMLSPECLNDKGRIIDMTASDWVNLTNTDSFYRRSAVWEVTFNEEGIAKATVNEVCEDLAGYRERDRIRDKGSYEKFIEDISRPEEGYTVTKYEISNQDEIQNPLNQKIELELDKKYINGDLIIFSPLFTEATVSNPFKLEKREYPVEFNYPMKEKVSVTTIIPEGYKVESLPRNLSLTLPGGAASYGFQVMQKEGAIVAEYEYNLKKMIFLPDEYTGLKDFFKKMVESQNQSVVLVKSGV